MLGAQDPRYQVEPRRVRSYGEDAAELMAAYAYPPDPWQRRILDCWLGVDERGAFSTTSAGLSVPRQNGKNFCLEAIELYTTVVLGGRVLHTAHQVRTSKKAFRRIEAIFTSKRHPELAATVQNIRYTNGEEAIELDNGGSIEFATRSRQAARGFSGVSLVVFDEAQELTEDQVEAIMATLSASATGTRQIIYTGTPPYPGCPGTVFRRRREISLNAPGPHDAWHEWSAEGPSVDALALDSPALWAMTNPALGRRLTEDFTREELRTMSADGFARERLGWWSPALVSKPDTAIPAELWDSCRSEALRPEGKIAYGVSFSADGSEVSLCGAVLPSDGPARISLIERKPTAQGTRWLAAWLNERYQSASCVVIDGRNGVDLLAERLSDTWRAKGSVIRPRAGDVVAAASMLLDALQEHAVTWYGPQEALRDSAVTSTRRAIGGGWGFGGDDPCPIAACALALWGVRTAKRDPTRRMLIG